jgi:hypothetical protein
MPDSPGRIALLARSFAVHPISRGEGADAIHLHDHNGCSCDPPPGGFICHPGPMVDLRLVSHLGTSLLASREQVAEGQRALMYQTLPPKPPAGNTFLGETDERPGERAARGWHRTNAMRGRMSGIPSCIQFISAGQAATSSLSPSSPQAPWCQAFHRR